MKKNAVNTHKCKSKTIADGIKTVKKRGGLGILKGKYKELVPDPFNLK